VPKGPISRHTITGGDYEPVLEDHTLTLKFKLQSYIADELDCDELARMLHEALRDYMDGRHPFNAEMVSVGLGNCLNGAFYNLIEKECQDEFGHETVPHEGGNGYTAKWCIEAEKRYAAARKPWLNDEPEVEIT
jgi:hypothetical protein